MADFGNDGAYDDRIRKDVPRTSKIVLTCKNHPGKLWWTKNIGYVGARSIFYNLKSDASMGYECDCPLQDLVFVEPQPNAGE